FRVVHGEADLLPGLIVDRYGDVAVIQTAARGMDAREPELALIVERALGARIVVARDDGGARDFEGLERRKGILRGKGSTLARWHDAGNEFEADVLTDGKTGGFLDQVENHARVAEYVRPGDDALDAFTYHGGFALAPARAGQRAVLALDESAPAVERTRANAARNGLTNVATQQSNAFDSLRALEGEGRRFDVVVIDPPALAKRKSALTGAERAYKELNLRALPPGAITRRSSACPRPTTSSVGSCASSSSRTKNYRALALRRLVRVAARRAAARARPRVRRRVRARGRVRGQARRQPRADSADPDAGGDRARADGGGERGRGAHPVGAGAAHRGADGAAGSRAAAPAAVRRVRAAGGRGARAHLAHGGAARHRARRFSRRRSRPPPRARGQRHHPGDAGLLRLRRRIFFARGGEGARARGRARRRAGRRQRAQHRRAARLADRAPPAARRRGRRAHHRHRRARRRRAARRARALRAALERARPSRAARYAGADHHRRRARRRARERRDA